MVKRTDALNMVQNGFVTKCVGKESVGTERSRRQCKFLISNKFSIF
ncbi:MAG: hypothetical protein IPM82_22865 [Saprospiraceae bacterium]|nr:hypothetical protein [Saprospiraceae bacterium]